MVKQISTRGARVRISPLIVLLYDSLTVTRKGGIYAWLLDEASDEPKILTASDVTHVATCDNQVAITTTTHIIKWRAGDKPNTLKHPITTQGIFFCHGTLFVVSGEAVKPLGTLLLTITEYDDDKSRNRAAEYTLPLLSDGSIPITFDVRRIDDSGTYTIGRSLSNNICTLLLYDATARQFGRRDFPEHQDWFSRLEDEFHIWNSSIYTVRFQSTPKKNGSVIHTSVRRIAEDGQIFDVRYPSARLNNKAWDTDYSNRKIRGDTDYLVLFAEQGYLVRSLKSLPPSDRLGLEYLAYEI